MVVWVILLAGLLCDLLSPLNNPYRDLRLGKSGRGFRVGGKSGLSGSQRARLDLCVYVASAVLLAGGLAGVYYNSVLTNASRGFFRCAPSEPSTEGEGPLAWGGH